jgi:hypothetical protein
MVFAKYSMGFANNDIVFAKYMMGFANYEIVFAKCDLYSQ